MATVPYGSWKSPITSQMTTESGVEFTQLFADTDSVKVYWSEIHYSEAGRYVVCSADKDGKIEEWTPKEFNARTRIHEYGGAAFFVHKDIVYFSNFGDQILYRQTSPNSVPEAIVDTTKEFRYADGRFCSQKSRIYCVREDHEVIKTGAKEAQNTVVSINPDTKKQTVVASGADFYISPRVSPNGKYIAWVQWMHSNMPWDSTEIWRAQLSESGDGVVDGSSVMVVGGKDANGQDLSVIQPFWSAENELLFIGDQTDWWNLYHVTSAGEHVNLRPVSEEVGGPEWTMGRTPYVMEPNGGDRIVTTFKGEFGILNRKTKAYEKVDTGYSSHSYLGWADKSSVYCLAHSATKFSQVIRVNVDTLKVDVIKVSVTAPVGKDYFSVPQKISWGTGNDETCHGLYYPPINKDFKAPDGDLPPVLIRAHGGPTGAFFTMLDLKLQYFTSRGFAVLCVDYRGSTGYGKAYRHRLRNQWGILDVEDCCSGVKHLAAKGLADPKRSCIDGRSAGGFTTLACLTFTDTFQVGVSHFGVSDLKSLMEETHKFESRYLDSLLLPLDQGGREICKERSPINFTDKLNVPMGFFQGDEDKIVPPNQAEMMFEAVKAKGIPAMMVLFKGEQHGFRKAENIQKSLDGEFYFFGKVLGFEPADKGIELPIENLAV